MFFRNIILVYLCIIGPSVFAQKQNTQIAFLSDIHFQDLYGSFSDNEFKGVPLPGTEKSVILRTMNAQLHSTRIFNENYFAFIEALDDVVKRGIKIVALPGDFTDDGQAYNLRGLRKILDDYSQKHGLQFFITTGNHDPVGPFWQDGGKNDFLGEDGKPIGIYSSEKLATKPRDIVTKDIAMSGYLEILSELKSFGFSPSPQYLYWSTPFSALSPANYTFAEAEKIAGYEKRMYEVTPGFEVPDLSYVAEPVEGIWLVAIDGNTYIPKDKNAAPDNAKNYNGSSVGYNQVLSNKTHLISWIKRLTEEAEKLGKTVVAFTHYPMVEYNDNASKEIESLLGKNKWQLHRKPTENVAKAFSEAGLKVHFGGHMHINDTGIKRFENGKMLVNVQIPSLAAYLPAYKIVTVKPDQKLLIETVILDNVKGFNRLFPLYEKEHETLSKSSFSNIWNKDILKTKNYRDFTLFHLKELVRLRFTPNDWPKDFILNACALSGAHLYQIASGRKISKAYSKWNFEDLLLDLYKFQSGDELAKSDIPKRRLKQYEVLCKQFSQLQTSDEFQMQLKTFFVILEKLSHGEPANTFEIDLKNQRVSSK
jgi:hypothetical protein